MLKLGLAQLMDEAKDVALDDRVRTHSTIRWGKYYSNEHTPPSLSE
jgi:hypothetical protein